MSTASSTSPDLENESSKSPVPATRLDPVHQSSARPLKASARPLKASARPLKASARPSEARPAGEKTSADNDSAVNGAALEPIHAAANAPTYDATDLLVRQLAELEQAYTATERSANGNAKDVGVGNSAESVAGGSTYRFDDTELEITGLEIPARHHFAAALERIGRDQLGPSPVARMASAGLASAGLASAGLANPAPYAKASGTDGATLALEPPAVSGPLDGLAYVAVKRLLDVAISATMLVLLSPLLFLTALLVKLTDGGAVFYRHIRIGEGGNEFTCYKFRSMVVNAEKMKANLAFFNSHDDHKTFKIPNDPRVTWIGRWMRRTSIDELPQLLNVLQGEMSIVGPRPPVACEVEKYTWQDMQRLSVKPGLTCIWQVSGRSRLPFPEQLKMDLHYIENRSLALDLKLILLTVPAVLSADGAY